MDNPQPNAFATGRNPQHAAVAVTTGLLRMLSREEIAGVIAHELAHIKNHDTLTMTITATIAGAISMLAQFGMFFGGGHRDNNNGLGVIGTLAMMILAPIAAMLVQMAISRTREYAADDLGARISGRPDALASALLKISNAAQQIENYSAERNPATAHLFIVNPLTHHGIDNLFSTHPSTENRVAALERLAAEMGRGGFGAARPHPTIPHARRAHGATPVAAAVLGADGLDGQPTDNCHPRRRRHQLQSWPRPRIVRFRDQRLLRRRRCRGGGISPITIMTTEDTAPAHSAHDPAPFRR